MSPHRAVDGGKFTHSRQLLVMRLVSCQGRQPTTWLRPMLLHKSPQAAGDRGQTNKFHAAFRDDLRVAEAGNRPFGYDSHSYASHHMKQLIGGKLTNFRQLLVKTCKLPIQKTDHLTHAPTQVTTGRS